MEVFGLSRVCHENYPFEEVNDNNDFEASKLGETIEWEESIDSFVSHSIGLVVYHGVFK